MLNNRFMICEEHLVISKFSPKLPVKLNNTVIKTKRAIKNFLHFQCIIFFYGVGRDTVRHI